jgi:hypothetical protein
MKTNDKTFRIVLTSSLLVIVVALAVLFSPSSDRDTRRANRLMNFNSMMHRDGEEMGTATSGGFAYSDKSMVAADSFMPSPMPPSYGGQTAAEADEQRIIKSADLALAVDGVEAKTYDIISIATGRGGFVQSSNLVEDQAGYKTGYVTVRVPSETFEDSVAAIKELAVRVERESINGQDVTEQYTDLEARLRSAQAQEEQYLEILDQATTVQDILAVQSYLQSIRYEIESLQGQIDSLGNQTEYSTISVSLSEEVRVKVPTEKFDLGRDIRLAFDAVVRLAQAALTFLVFFVIVGGAIVIPAGLFIALIVWVIKKIVARF